VVDRFLHCQFHFVTFPSTLNIRLDLEHATARHL
jgi:hypothetical protein